MDNFTEDNFKDLDATLNDGLQSTEEVVEEVKPVKKKKTPAKKAKPAVEAPVAKEAPKKAAGIYHNGELVEVVKSQTPKQWVAFIKGRKIVAAPFEFEVVE